MGIPKHIVILCGASNLQLAFPIYVKAILARLEPPVEIYAAMGCGRSYGKWAGIGGLIAWPGIVQSNMQERLLQQKAPDDTRVHALVTDVGNDIMYMVEPPMLLGWLKSLLTTFDSIHANVAATAMPMDSLRDIPAWKYNILRRLYGTRCTLTRQESLDRAAEVQGQIESWGRAGDGSAPRLRGRLRMLPTRREWYGFDHIHIRFWRRKLAVQCWLDEWLGPVQYEVPRIRESNWKLTLLPAEERRVRGNERTTPQNEGIMLTDGVTVRVY